MEGLLGRLSALIPGAAGMSDEDKRALVTQGLLSAGLGILSNNQGHYGKAGPAIGAGLLGGLGAINRGAGDLADNKYKQQMMAMQSADPAGFRAMDKMARAAGYEPGTQGYKDFFRRDNGELARQSSAAIQYKPVPGPDGRTRWVAFDPREVGGQVVGGQGGYDIDPSLPPQVQEVIRQSEASGQPMPPHIDLAPAIPRPSPTAGTNPFVSRRPEDEAAAVAAAQKSVELGALPTELAMRTNAAIQQSQGSASALAGVERDTVSRQKVQALQQFEAAKQGLIEGLSGTETGPIAGRLPAFTTGQQVAEGGVAAMAPILKQIFRVAGEGTFTDRDQALLMEMLPTRRDTPEAAGAKLQNIDRIIQTKLAPTQSAGHVKRYNPATGKIE